MDILDQILAAEMANDYPFSKVIKLENYKIPSGNLGIAVAALIASGGGNAEFSDMAKFWQDLKSNRSVYIRFDLGMFQVQSTAVLVKNIEHDTPVQLATNAVFQNTDGNYYSLHIVFSLNTNTNGVKVYVKLSPV